MYGNEKITFPKGIEAQIYGWEIIEKGGKNLLICEGELDRLVATSKGLAAITSTHGAATFKEDWAKEIGGKFIFAMTMTSRGKRERNERRIWWQMVAKMRSI